MKLIFDKYRGKEALKKLINASKEAKTTFISKKELDEMERLASQEQAKSGEIVFEEPQAKILVKMLLLVNIEAHKL